MKKPIEIIVLKEAELFIDNLDDSAKKKLFFAFNKTKQGIKGEWFKKMTGTNGIYEFRIIDKGYIRLFAFWDNTGDENVLIITTHGIVKKSAKTPPKEIEKAEQIQTNYFNEKQK
jgi:phage-related protein